MRATDPMSAILLGHHEPNTPEWDALRSKGLGGSEIAAVVGLSPWVSKFALYHRKRGTLGKQEVNAGMSWGHRLEPAVCDAWAERRPLIQVRTAGMYHHADRPWQIANPDRLFIDATNPKRPFTEGGDGLLEVKTASAFDAYEWGPSGTESIPPYYRCQVLWYMDTLALPEAHMAVLIGGSDYREYVIPYAADEAEWLREAGAKFWQDVIDGNAPEIDGHDATYQAVREMHPDIERDVVAEIDGDLFDLYRATKQQAEDAAAEHRKAKARVLEQIGQAHYGAVGDTKVLRRQPSGKGAVALYEVKQPANTEPKGDAA